MDTVYLRKADTAFTKEIEQESGERMRKCYQCGNCSAGCPMNFTYDYSVTQIMRLIQTGQREAVLGSRAIWMCATCEICTMRCPNDIRVANIMDVCRHKARREGYLPSPLTQEGRARKFFESFIDMVWLFGRTYEAGIMASYMLRTGRMLTDLDLVPKVLPKNKLPLLPHFIKGRKEVARIISRFKEENKHDTKPGS